MNHLERLAKKHGRLIISVEAADDDDEIEYRVSCGLTAPNFGVGETLDEALDDFEEVVDAAPDNERRTRFHLLSIEFKKAKETVD